MKGKKTQESSRALETIVAVLEAKHKSVAMRAYFHMKSLKLTTEITQPLTERAVEPDRAMQTLQG